MKTIDPPARRSGAARSNIIWLMLGILVIALLAQRFRSDPADLVAWQPMSVVNAQAASAPNDKPVLLYFTATWCGPCKDVKHAIYSRQDAADRLASLVIPVKVDLTDPTAPQPLAMQYEVQSIPTFILLDPDGTVLSRTAGSMGRDNFFAWLERGIARRAAANADAL